MNQPTLTVTIPLEVYEAAVSALERAQSALPSGETEKACRLACYDMQIAIRTSGRKRRTYTPEEAEQWMKDSMDPATREHYFGAINA